MDEKKRSICNWCSIVAIISLLIYIVAIILGSNVYLLAIRIAFATIATIAYAIRLSIEIAYEQKFINSFFLFFICLFDLAMSAAQLVITLR